MALTRFEICELALIVGAVGVTYGVTDGLVWRPAYGHALCYAAALLLGQGLIRDIAVLIRRRLYREVAELIPAPAKSICLCAESSLGVLGILAGTLTLLAGVDQAIDLPGATLTASVGLVFMTGFVLKDIVLTVRREKDHANVLVGLG